MTELLEKKAKDLIKQFLFARADFLDKIYLPKSPDGSHMQNLSRNVKKSSDSLKTQKSNYSKLIPTDQRDAKQYLILSPVARGNSKHSALDSNFV